MSLGSEHRLEYNIYTQKLSEEDEIKTGNTIMNNIIF